MIPQGRCRGRKEHLAVSLLAVCNASCSLRVLCAATEKSREGRGRAQGCAPGRCARRGSSAGPREPEDAEQCQGSSCVLTFFAAEPVGEATSQPMSTTEPQGEDEGRSRPFPWESCQLRAQRWPAGHRCRCQHTAVPVCALALRDPLPAPSQERCCLEEGGPWPSPKSETFSETY